MPTADSVKASYRRDLNETATIRRFTGTGTSRPKFEVSARARVTGYEPKDLIGAVQQGDRKVTLYADDLIDGGLTLPVTVHDKVVVRGKEFAIVAVDDSTRRIGGVLIAIDLQARG